MITLLNKFDDNYVLEKKDIYDIASCYIQENKIEKHLSDIVFTKKSNVIAHYNINTKEIVLNDDRIIRSCYKLYDGLQRIYDISEDYYTYYLNFYYLYIIYHELKHVSQKALYEEDNNVDIDIHNYLYILGSILRSNNLVFYKENHDIFPLEIEANNFGYQTAYNLMNYTKLPRKETNVMYLQYLFSLIYNYQKNNSQVISPIELLKEKNDIVDMGLIKELMNKAKLSKIERMNLGLPITSKEYDSVEHEKQKVLIKTI